MLLFKLILVILLVFVIGSLVTSFYFLVKDPSSSKRVVKTLSVRIGLCIVIMLLLLIGAKVGLIVPHGFGE